ncbi:MAG: ABC transporter ATP-binding protein [Halanaeroarchaeum sp.]
MRLTADVRATFTAPGADPFDVDAAIEVDEGETVVVLGPSGSGKTLLLESIAGFHRHDGHVRLGDRDVTDDPPETRGFGFVFQDYGLFPHLTVRENVAFGQRYRGASWSDRARALLSGGTRRDRLRRLALGDPGERDERSLRTRLWDLLRLRRTDPGPDPAALLADLGVADLADRYPPTLSGGEAQRVALARALAVEPSALLLDEPLSALDVPTRQSLRADLATALASVTSVYVTHNRTTARAIADRIAVMRDGEIVQVGTPERVFESPETAFVARFVGANVLPGDPFDRRGRVAIRPEHVRLDPADPDGTATVVRTAREDAATRVILDWNGDRLEAFAADPPAVGDVVGVGLPVEHLSDLA